jgi:hypothetical protein
LGRLSKPVDFERIQLCVCVCTIYNAYTLYMLQDSNVMQAFGVQKSAIPFLSGSLKRMGGNSSNLIFKAQSSTRKKKDDMHTISNNHKNTRTNYNTLTLTTDKPYNHNTHTTITHTTITHTQSHTHNTHTHTTLTMFFTMYIITKYTSTHNPDSTTTCSNTTLCQCIQHNNISLPLTTLTTLTRQSSRHSTL